MKVAIVVEKFPVISETFIINQIVGLIKSGHEVDIHCTQNISLDNSLKIHPDVVDYELLKIIRNYPQVPENFVLRVLQAIKLIAANFYKYPSIIQRSLNIFKYGRRAASLRLLYLALYLIKAPNYDIVHCQFGTIALDEMILRDIGAIKGKLITCFRGYDISLFVQENGKNVYDKLFAKGDFFLSNCEFFRNKAIELGCDPKKILVHGSAIDCSRFPFKDRYPHPNQKIRIATTGRLIEKKGIEYAIRAVAEVAKLYPNIEYQIIGDGELKETLQQLIKSLNITDKVKILGWKTQPEIVDVLGESDIFIAPSITAKDGNQDAPVNTLKEAMLMGLPVIATNHGGIPELVQDGISGFLVPERDAEAIAKKIIYLIEHPEIWSSIGRSGRDYVESNYDIEKLNDDLVEIYHQVMMNNLPNQAPTLTSAVALI
ncbi:MAG TPA: glycosyltransferase [Leptolyngbyaceae cyanobacterium]